MDVASRENGPALDGHELDRCPGANRKPNSHFDFHSDRELRDLSSDRQGFPTHAAPQNWDRPLYHGVVVRRDCLDPGTDRRGTEAEYQLAIARLRHPHAWRSDGFDH